MRIIDHVSDVVMQQENAGQYVTLIDALQQYKDTYVNAFSNSKYPLASASITTIKRYLRELGNLPISYYFNLHIYECLLTNIDYIMSKKGTLNGLTRFFECISLGTVLIDGTGLIVHPNYYILDSYFNGSLELTDDDDGINGVSMDKYPDNGFLFLFDDGLSTVTNSLTITIWTDFKDDPEFERYVRYMIPRLFPAVSDRTEITLILNYP